MPLCQNRLNTVMAHALQNRVEQVRAAGRRLLWWYALARFVAAVLLIAAGLCLIDYLLRLHDPLARWLLSSLAVALAVIAFLKIAWPSLRAAPQPHCHGAADRAAIS